MAEVENHVISKSDNQYPQHIKQGLCNEVAQLYIVQFSMSLSHPTTVLKSKKGLVQSLFANIATPISLGSTQT